MFACRSPVSVSANQVSSVVRFRPNLGYENDTNNPKTLKLKTKALGRILNRFPFWLYSFPWFLPDLGNVSRKPDTEPGPETAI